IYLSSCCNATPSFFLTFPLPPRSTPFPYTTLFRSRRHILAKASLQGGGHIGARDAAEHAGDQHGSIAQAFDRNARCIHRRRVLADRKSTRLNSSHVKISYAVFCLKKKIQ